jgi:anti-sigma B factor antagonist
MAELTPSDGALTVGVEDADRRAIVRLAGELDLSSISGLEVLLDPLLVRSDLDEIVFDLADLGFIDSSGLAVLVKVAGSGKRVLLRRPSYLVREVIGITGLDTLLPVET